MADRTTLSEYQNHLVMTHLELAHRVANDFQKRSQGAIELEEVVSIAYQGLIAAALRFDPNWRPPDDPKYEAFLAFGSFARRKIAGAILDWQRTQDPVPRRQRQVYKTLQSHGHGSGLSAEALSDITGMPADKIRTITSAVEVASFSLDSSDDLPDRGKDASVEGSALVSTVQDAVADAISSFPDVQRSVVVLRYYSGMDFPSIAIELGVSVMTVRSLHADAVSLLHGIMRDATHA